MNTPKGQSPLVEDVEEKTSQLPICSVCSKRSDAAQRVGDVSLCGTDYDRWLRSFERPRGHLADFIRRVQAELRNGH